MTAATVVPADSAGFTEPAITPTHSMPRIRGNVTVGEKPSRVMISDRLSPDALTWTRVQPSRGSGIGTSRTVRTSGGPGRSATAARITPVTGRILRARRAPQPPPQGSTANRTTGNAHIQQAAANTDAHSLGGSARVL